LLSREGPEGAKTFARLKMPLRFYLERDPDYGSLTTGATDERKLAQLTTTVSPENGNQTEFEKWREEVRRARTQV